MINIYFNDEEQQIELSQSLQELLIINDYQASCFAVTVNNQLIPRIAYSTTRLNSEDRVDILIPMQGG